MQKYDIWDVRREREIFSGLYAAPASSGGGATVRLHDPIEYCIVTFFLKTTGDWPFVPSHDSLIDDGYTLLHAKQVGHVPCPSSNVGEHAYVISGFYSYVRTGTAGAPNDDLKTGVVPGDTGLSQEGAILKKAYFLLGLIQSNYFNNNPAYPPT